MTDRWFSLGNPVSSTNKTDHHDIAEILLKVVLNTIYQATISAEHTVLRNKSKDWLAQNQDNVSEWSSGQLFEIVSVS